MRAGHRSKRCAATGCSVTFPRAAAALRAVLAGDRHARVRKQAVDVCYGGGR